MKGLIKRIATAIIFVIVMLGGLYGGRYSFVALFALITSLCLWEYLSLTLQNDNETRVRVRKILGLLIGLLPFGLTSLLMLQSLNSVYEYVAVSVLLFFPLLFSVFIFELFSKSEHPFRNAAFIVLGMVYIGIPFALVDLIAFGNGQFSANIIFGLLLLTWTNDTAAYLVGSQIGKTPLFPRISPNKTWEGTIGGVLITLVVAWLLSLWLSNFNNMQWLILGGIVALFGSLGDLVESMLKRSLSIKDSGSLLPGHGGLLDRFDAFIFLLPFATAYILLLR